MHIYTNKETCFNELDIPVTSSLQINVSATSLLLHTTLHTVRPFGTLNVEKESREYQF